MKKNLCMVSLLLFVLPGCGDEEADVQETTAQTMTLRFRPMVGAAPFACGTTYEGLGRKSSSFTPSDFRLYIHDITLGTASGKRVPARFEPDGIWAQESVALLDFEDGTATCVNGTPQTRLEARIIADVSPADVTSVAFSLGVPEALNHQDQAVAGAPLNLSGLWWSWMGGYKFAKIDGKSDALDAVLFHLGSQGCTGEVPAVTCSMQNRPKVALSSWSPSKEIVIDLGGLLKDAHLDADEGGAPGCMSGPTDPDCAPLFDSLGLGAKPPASSPVFRSM